MQPTAAVFPRSAAGFHPKNVLFQRHHQFLWFLCSSWFHLRKSWAQSPNEASQGQRHTSCGLADCHAVMGPALIARPIIHWRKRLFNIKLIYTNKSLQCLIIFKEVAFLGGCVHPGTLNSPVIKSLFFLLRALWNLNEPKLVTIFKTLWTDQIFASEPQMGFSQSW